MPIITDSEFSPPKILENGHTQTLYTYFFRKVDGVKYERVRIETPDDDFLDIDHTAVGSDHLVILSHGLEGSTDTGYIRGMMKYFSEKGIDTIGWNMRSCSGELNRQKRFYHAASTDDLETVISYARSLKRYKKISLVGFSLGGNLTLFYIGQKGKSLYPELTNSIVFSSPVDLSSSIDKLEKPGFGKIYTENFLNTMRQKLIAKNEIMDMGVDLNGIDKIKSFREFDDKYTAPISGFKDGADYYSSASSLQHLDKIVLPTLIVNAKNDPFLPAKCYPLRQAEKNPNLHLEIPESGGHVGFVHYNEGLEIWSEQRAEKWILSEAS